MHILILPSWYKTPVKPLSGTFFEEQARMLMRRGHQVSICYLYFFESFSARWRQSAQERQPPNMIDQGLPTYYKYVYNLVPGNPKINFTYFRRIVLSFFRQYVRKHGYPDIIHAHSVIWAGLAAKFISKAFSIPYVLTEHYTGFVIRPIEERVKNWVESTFAHARNVIVVSHSYLQDLKDRFEFSQTSTTVIPNVVSPLFYDSLLTPPSHGPFTFFHLAFMQDKKNQRLLINAFKCLGNSDVVLKIGGDGPERGSLEKLVEKLGLQDRIRFLGSLNREQVKREMDRCHAFALSSNYETFGVVVIEAMACGRPVISTACGGPEDIIVPENGLLVYQKSPEAYAEGMKQIVDQYATFDTEQIRRSCLDRYAEGVISSQVEAVYKKVMGIELFESEL